MASYNPPAGSDPNGHLQAMYARLQAARAAQDENSEAAQDPYSRFNYNQGNTSQGYYGQSAADSPVTGLDDFPPPAPSPPSTFGPPHHPTGITGNLAPIGTMPSTATSKADQSANLLNLLKFSGAQAQISQPNPQDSPSAYTQASFDHSPRVSHINNPPPIHAPVPMPADPQGLLATLMKGNMQNEGQSQGQGQGQGQSQVPRAEPQANTHRDTGTWNSLAPSMDTQQYLLNLLHRPKPAQNDQPATNEPPHPTTLTPQSANGSAADHASQYGYKPTIAENNSHDNTPISLKFGTQEHVESPAAKLDYYPSTSQHDNVRRPTRFDYTSPFEEFSTAPHTKTSKSSTPGNSASITQMPTELPAATGLKLMKKTPSVTSSPGLLAEQKRFGSQRSPITNPEHALRNTEGSPFGTEPIRDLSPNAAGTPTNGTHKTVSEAISDLAEKASLEAQEAIARAEQEEVRNRIAVDLEHMMGAKTDAEFQEAAQAVAKDIKHELDKDEHLLEDNYSPEVAQTIRDIVEDTAHGPVADSWESAEAEAEEIVVIEENPNPIKVYNFPMKPWISITIQDTDEPRPQFRDEVILDIARLKKEFDQIDRNLVAATEFCMVYGMSKAGGLRVIRQDDGKDAKLFTDTKDRVFNVAVSTTPPDVNTTPKESIIGTGISGTVYYVQIRSGDKDHLEDAHPEQYGFALPPISAQEGDAPGGVLKTRARTSSTHPDYFAVGRGKTISIVWPAYVMQKNVFKPGHDRVVDTEKLSKECALRINTGKAGKDFTFSQDDTTIVSLDKSGRVKFWDVRDLTAADESSMPAHTSLEVKEPLMTLNTTPEGEKAWPTSVLLLDKQRPYQKRCALRYMIVGMKQNHTLQLWDLALGKPVQEFNLPHTKESDAVCSVTYHPPTGMIVVGHPTRNSIYFLHLSAPKYTIKGLSQVEYIQKLVARDSSIPEPESTAVISGVREYSFANKGVLRSLDILVNPTTSSEGDEQTLFELYAMHSKGVTALWIKQNELGWAKDNKVIRGVDAIDVGLVKISKLKELPSALVSEPPVAEESALPIRIATRPSAKETPPLQATSLPPGPEQTSRKGIENIHPNVQNERKEGDAPVTPVNQLDKSEKKARKKREKAAVLAEKLAAENQSNGNSHPSRVDSKNPPPSLQPTMSAESIQSAVKQISSGLSEKLSGVISNEFRQYQGKVETEFRKSGDAFSQSQKDLLALVSSVLNDNVQAVLSRIISDQFEANVVPHMTTVITKTIESQIDAKVGGKVSHSVQNQMQKSLPNAVFQALQRSELPKVISDKLVEGVALDMEESFRETLVNTITPVFSDMAVASARSVVQDVQRRTAEQIGELEQRHLADSHKIDQLTVLVAKLSDTVNTMASNQAQLQDGLIKIQQQLAARDRVSTIQSQPTQSLQTQALSYNSPTATSSNQLVPYPGSNSGARDPELQHNINSVASLMERGEYETGLVRWIQQSRKHEVFDEYLVKFNPQFMQDMPALVSLSVASVIAEQLEGPLLREKVAWIEIVLNSLQSALPHITDAQVRDVVPNIMGTFLTRIEKLFMQISSRSPTDPILQHLSRMIHVATQIRDYARKAVY